MSQWHIIDFSSPEELPRQGREIYFAMSEGEGKPFSATGRMRADLVSFRDILNRQPNSLIIWRPCPRTPSPPQDYSIVRRMHCCASESEKRRCIYWKNNDICLKTQEEEMRGEEGRCGKMKPRLELCEQEVVEG